MILKKSMIDTLLEIEKLVSSNHTRPSYKIKRIKALLGVAKQPNQYEKPSLASFDLSQKIH